jgi:hypothetical protein
MPEPATRNSLPTDSKKHFFGYGFRADHAGLLNSRRRRHGGNRLLAYLSSRDPFRGDKTLVTLKLKNLA